MRDSGSRFFEQEIVWSFKRHGSDSQRCGSYSQSFHLSICDPGLDPLPQHSVLICKMMELEQVISRISHRSPRSQLQEKTNESKYPLRASSPGGQGTVSFPWMSIIFMASPECPSLSCCNNDELAAEKTKSNGVQRSVCLLLLPR